MPRLTRADAVCGWSDDVRLLNLSVTNLAVGYVGAVMAGKFKKELEV